MIKMRRSALPFVVAGVFFMMSFAATADDKPPMGWLIGELGDTGITVSGWAEFSFSAIDNDGGDSTLPQAFFNREEGFTTNQIGLFIEKKPKGNVVGRVGPFPGPMPEEVDIGFNITAIYGSDALFFRTIGWDDDFNDNSDPTEDEFFVLAQAFLDVYIPILGGSNLMLGVFHTPLENEIGFSLPPPAPAPFFTRSLGFMHGPAKHAGALFSFKLPTEEGAPLWGGEIGLVRGWNNWDDENDDLDVIFNVRWRSPDLATWIDWENIYGNGADDSFAATGLGSPIPAISALAGDDDLTRYVSFLTVSHALDPKNRIVVEFTYGSQENALFAGNRDAEWKGVNVNWHHQFRPDLSFNVRGELFDTEGVHALLPVDGTVKALTANLTWNVNHALRIRPEVRYDTFDGNGNPYNGEDDQLFGVLDVIFTF